jgi:hypothetical protein
MFGISRKAALAAAVFAVGATSAVQAADNKYSFAAGVDASSHFISFGSDVWGGGANFSPFSAHSTTFGHATLTAAFTPELSGFINVWSDLNDNVDSGIGGPIQEVDLNVGLTYTWNKFTFGGTYSYWMFGGGAEKAIELSASFNDADLLVKGLALNPSFLAHYRYDVTGDLDEENACVLQVGISPSYTFLTDTEYPITVSIPAAFGYFTDSYAGGDGAGIGYADVGVTAAVPLAFIPKEYGSWTASANITFYNTPSDDHPANPRENFLVTTLSIGMAF